MEEKTTERKPVYDSANQLVDKAEEKLFDSMERVRDAGEKLIDKVGDTEERFHVVAAKSTQSINSFVARKPLQSAGIAFAAGIVATLILSRSKS